MSDPLAILGHSPSERKSQMIVCRKCDEVLYVGTMPENCNDFEIVMCASCAYDYTMEALNEYENNAYDLIADR